jgi:hypothetical protein
MFTLNCVTKIIKRQVISLCIAEKVNIRDIKCNGEYMLVYLSYIVYYNFHMATCFEF